MGDQSVRERLLESAEPGLALVAALTIDALVGERVAE